MEEHDYSVEVPLEILDEILKYLSPEDKYKIYKAFYPSDTSNYILQNIVSNFILKDNAEKLEFFEYAIKDRNYEITKELISVLEIDPNKLLIDGIKSHDKFIIDVAIENGANNLNEALVEAVHEMEYILINNLISWGASESLALEEAVATNNFELVDYLMHRYKNLNNVSSLNKVLGYSITGEMINYLLDLGADDYLMALNVSAKIGELQLFNAFARILHEKYVKESGSIRSAYKIDDILSQALVEIGAVRDLEVVDDFINLYAKIFDKNVIKIIEKAAERGNLDIIKYLISRYKIPTRDLNDAGYLAYKGGKSNVTMYFDEIGVQYPRYNIYDEDDYVDSDDDEYYSNEWE